MTHITVPNNLGHQLSLLEKYKNKIRHETKQSLLSLGYSGITIDSLMIRFEKDHVSRITRIPASDSQMPDRNKETK